MSLGLEEFIAVDDSEASDAGSPRFEAGMGADTHAAGSGVVGTSSPQRVEEVEEEDSDVHFKRKRGSGSCRKSLAKKPRRQAPTIVVEDRPSTKIPPAAPLAAEPSVAGPTSGGFAPGLGKINPVHIIRLWCIPNNSLFASCCRS